MTQVSEERMLEMLADRLKAKSKAMPNGCIEWTGAINLGYGRTTYGLGVNLPTHRAAYALANGLHPKFKGGVIRHTCDNPPCINPEHLVLGTHGENAVDRMEHGRQIRGEAQHCAKLNPDMVRAIRGDKRPGAAIARGYGVGEMTVSKIKRRQTWKHIA